MAQDLAVVGTQQMAELRAPFVAISVFLLLWFLSFSVGPEEGAENLES